MALSVTVAVAAFEPRISYGPLITAQPPSSALRLTWGLSPAPGLWQGSLPAPSSRRSGCPGPCKVPALPEEMPEPSSHTITRWLPLQGCQWCTQGQGRAQSLPVPWDLRSSDGLMCRPLWRGAQSSGRWGRAVLYVSRAPQGVVWKGHFYVTQILPQLKRKR